jgi:hypothetical protein
MSMTGWGTAEASDAPRRQRSGSAIGLLPTHRGRRSAALADNQVVDWGTHGLVDTIDTLDRANVPIRCLRFGWRSGIGDASGGINREGNPRPRRTRWTAQR